MKTLKCKCKFDVSAYRQPFFRKLNDLSVTLVRISRLEASNIQTQNVMHGRGNSLTDSRLTEGAPSVVRRFPERNSFGLAKADSRRCDASS